MSSRLLVDHNVKPCEGLALDDALACGAVSTTPTLRLYTYQPCVLVGRFQDFENQVNEQNCLRLNVAVNRRPSGGGTIVMGPEQLGIALIIPKHQQGFPTRSSELMAYCSRGIINALGQLGIVAKFAGKNDLISRGRKIAGLGLYQPGSGGRLFHASLLLDLDFDFMTRVLRLPVSDDGGIGRDVLAKRVMTVRSELGDEYSMSELIETVQSGFNDELCVQFEAGEVISSEKVLADELVRNQYSSWQWVYDSPSSVVDRMGHSSSQTAAGDLNVRVIVAGSMMKSVYLSGNFMVSDIAVYALESSLRWHPTDATEVRRTIARSVDENADSWDRMSVDDIASTLLNAVERCEINNPVQPGACFARDVELEHRASTYVG